MATDTPTRADIDVAVTSGDFVVLPEDVYVCEFVDFETDLPAEAQAFGPAVRLNYVVAEGDYAGEKLDELASLKGGPKAKLRQRVNALSGGEYGEQTIRLVPLLGKRLKLVVKVTGDEQKGFFNKIDSSLPLPAPRAATPRPTPTASVGTGAPAGSPARKF